MSSIFSKIIAGEIPGFKILEDENFYAFLDIMPLASGHTLVVPKIEMDYIFDLDNQLLSAALPFAKKVASAMERAIPCQRIGIAVIGLEVPHAHIHLIPLQTMDDINFSKPKLKMTQQELTNIAEKIKSFL
ncbi:MAG: HIT family protein [Bacteroidetes bacterium]|nr:HIT family protein [Bacteroidota bacterium]MBP7398294.1 HIT family protein [Chitinophagales bacterium]MBK7108710.1 HIT family protein [Bacteroidota bacterium]MBK8488964.1 HIT family protein [Bacteroidota bacterium]MBK8680812.1 HIT family protein [Bacteroidota bacterium]